MRREGLLLLIVLCEGFLCQINPDYAVTANKSVTVQEGLCVLIQCTFTFSAEQKLGDKPNGFWFREGASSTRDKPVATNDASRPVSEDTRGRFKLVGNISNRDCTLRIDDAMKTDRGTYYLRIEGGYKFNYKDTTQPFVNVTDLWEQPELSCSAELVVGTPVSISCTAPGRCAGTAPTITWAGTLNTANSTVNTSSVIGNERVRHASTITFTPTLRDQNKTLTCAVDYPAVGASTQNTLTLLLQFGPIFGNDNGTICKSDPPKITCSCVIQSNPPPEIWWLINEELVIGNYSNSTLQVSSTIHGHTGNGSLTLQGNKGNRLRIACISSNKHGALFEEWTQSSEPKVGPIFGNDNGTICKSDPPKITCYCVIQSNPPPEIWWLINEELVIGNYSNSTLQVSSTIHGHTGNSSLTLQGSKGNRLRIACISSNKHGAVFEEWTQSSEPKVTEPSWWVMIQGGLGGAAIVAVIVLMIVLLHFGIKKIRKENTSEDKMVDEDNLIYSIIDDKKKSRGVAAEKKTAATTPTTMNPSTYAPEQVNENGNESLHYANIDFSKLNPSNKTPAESTDYSEIKLK